jgi:hypothetical protein
MSSFFSAKNRFRQPQMYAFLFAQKKNSRFLSIAAELSDMKEKLFSLF